MAIAAVVVLLALSGWATHHPWGWLMLLGLGVGYWFWQRFPQKTAAISLPRVPQRQQIKAELAHTHSLLQELPTTAQSSLQHTYAELQQRLETSTVELCILGQSQRWVTHLADRVASLNLPDCQLQSQGLDTVPQADLVLFAVTSALTASEFEMLRVLTTNHYRLLVVWCCAETSEAERIRVHLQQQLRQLNLSREQLLCLKDADMQPLAVTLLNLLAQERSSLVWAGTYRRAQQLHQQAQAALNRYRRERAEPIIQRYQWLGATATAVNPLPLLDLVMAGGLLVRLTWELGQVYQRSFRLADAEPVAKELLRLMVHLGAVELGSQSVGQWLKGNSLTYLAGSCLQGATTAYVLRLSGLSLIHYFETAPAPHSMPLGQHLQRSLQWARQQIGQSPLQALVGSAVAPQHLPQ